MARPRLLPAVFLLGLALALLPAARPAHAEETLSFGPFGTVALYRPAGAPASVVLFVSGDGGWNLGVVDMARSLAGLGALVVGVDIRRYLKASQATKEPCSYAAADFEALSHFVQKRLGLPRYLPPVLVGYSSGATLVYAVLVEAPAGTFRGALSLGFCPDLPLAKPLCRGSGLAWKPGPKGKGVVFEPAEALPAPWVAFQGEIDQVCDAAQTRSYVARVRGGQLVLLPRVGHGFSVEKNWLPQFRAAFAGMVADPSRAAAPAAVADLPLVEVPSEGKRGRTLAVLLSGDGGWAGLDRDVAGALAKRGVPVVGWNSLQYFWTARTPEGAALDLGRVLRHYLASWGAERAVVAGYSFGADVLPFLVRRLPADLRDRVGLVALLGPGRTASFEFHVTDWLGGAEGTRPVLPEAEALRGLNLLCVQGRGESDSLCPTLPPGLASVVTLEGKHHFGGDYEALAGEIARRLP